MTGGGNTLPSSGTRLPPSRSAHRLRLGPRDSILQVSHPWLLGALSTPAPHRSGGPRGLGPHVPQVPTPQLWCRPPDPQLEGHLSGAPHTLALCWAPVVASAQFAVAGLSDGAPHSGPEPRTPGGAPLQLPSFWRKPCPEAGLPSLGLTDGETEARRRARLSQHPGCHVFLGHLLLGEDGLGWLSEGLGSPWGDPIQGAKPGAISHAPLHGGP